MLSKIENPFKIFFPIGILFSIIGTFVWILFFYKAIHFYPGKDHPQLMIGGFLFSFVLGFLLTAIPKFTGSLFLSMKELSFILFSYTGMVLSLIFWNFTYFHIFLLSTQILLIRFLISRFLNRSHNLPKAFIFVGLGIFSILIGTVLTVLNDFSLLPPPLALLSKILYLKGFILSLLLGIGSRLIPALLGWMELPTAQLGKKEKEPYLLYLCFLSLLSGIVMEAFISISLGKILQTIPVTIIPLAFWKIHRKPNNPGFLSWLLIIGAWMLVMGFWGVILFPTYEIHLIHLAYIGAFGLITIMIASRVIISHTNLEPIIEKKSKLLLAVGVFIIFATITRLLSAISEKIYLSHLAYASMCWIAAVLIWSFLLFPKMLRKSN